MGTLGSTQRALRVAVVGAGPAGFYTSDILLKQQINVKVDLFEKLPAPFGLVRYGVAPDHEKIKNVIKVFEKTAVDPRFSYFGNVVVGQDVSVEELRNFYDATVYCHGAEADRYLGIKGEGLKGNYKASQFVGWYNGHPQFRNYPFDFSHEVAVIVGQGNVAIDIARILCSTKEELAKTDISQQALEVLSESKIREVHVYGRRGPIQASFTPVEIKEMGELSDCYPVVNPSELSINRSSIQEMEGSANSFRKKNLEILQSYIDFVPGNRKRKFVIHFNRTPVEILGDGRVEKARFEINDWTQKGDQFEFKGTGQFEELTCGAFFTSIGYIGVEIPGLPFSPQKGVVPNRHGRVLDNNDEAILGCYVSGWIGHGASGVIGTNKLRAEETVAAVIEDLDDLVPCKSPSTNLLLELLKSRKVEPITFIDWKKIDAYEIMLGLKLGKSREKITQVSQMVSVAKDSKNSAS